MKRNEFFKLCTGGVCGCAALAILPGTTSIAANTLEEKEDWRIGFIQERYAKLIEILGDQLGDEKRGEILELMGRECAKHFYERALKFKGDLKGYLDDIQKDWFEKVEYDQPIKNIRITDKLTKKCACPFVDLSKMNGSYCQCTVGWQKEIYSLVSGKEVAVTLESSVLRGDDKCVYKIVLDN